MTDRNEVPITFSRISLLNEEEPDMSRVRGVAFFGQKKLLLQSQREIFPAFFHPTDSTSPVFSGIGAVVFNSDFRGSKKNE